MAERLQVGLERLRRVAGAGQGRQIVAVNVPPLAAGHQLGAPEEQVEGVGVVRPGRVGVGIDSNSKSRVGDVRERGCAEG